jgi:hypothetical protein
LHVLGGREEESHDEAVAREDLLNNRVNVFALVLFNKLLRIAQL